MGHFYSSHVLKKFSMNLGKVKLYMLKAEVMLSRKEMEAMPRISEDQLQVCNK